MLTDIHWFISSCSFCAQAKVPRTLPGAKLFSLPAPHDHHTWQFDFITDTVIIDRISKSPKTVFNQVFKYFGIPKDIGSSIYIMRLEQLYGESGCVSQRRESKPRNCQILESILCRQQGRLGSSPPIAEFTHNSPYTTHKYPQIANANYLIHN